MNEVVFCKGVGRWVGGRVGYLAGVGGEREGVEVAGGWEGSQEKGVGDVVPCVGVEGAEAEVGG